MNAADPALVLAGVPPGRPRAQAPPAEDALPALREDLNLLSASDNRDGSPAWMIQDPVSNRFYRIGWLEFELLVRWQPSANALLAQVAAETTLAPDRDALKALQEFLVQHCLVRAVRAQDSERLAERSERERRRDLRWLVHHYLFVRIPLVRPERFLRATLPLVGFVYSRAFASLLLLATLGGLWLAGRQWDVFLASVQDSFTPAGIAAYLLALAAAKLLHELGHAFTATRYGVRVAHMGISLVVLFPMLYTDTSESWKLTQRGQRLAIVAAGLLTEIGVAGLATLGWSLTPDGPVRSALFFLATTSWILSLGINASPFMRFDGYFLLSDALDLPNLHARSSAFARAFLRRHLLGWREADPEFLPRGLARFLTAFAFATWLYRLVVFLGIALLVYLFFFKVLGIVLFAVEIVWFIGLPVWSELRVWWARRAETPLAWRLPWLLLAGLLGVFLAAPMTHGIHAPAWVHAERTLVLYAPYAARVTQVHAAGPVAAGSPLLTLDSPDIRARGARSAAASATLWSQLQRTAASADDGTQRREIGARLQRELAEGRGAREEIERLVLRSPFAGALADLDPLVQPGAWVHPQQPLGMLIDPASWIVDAFVDQRSLHHVRLGDRAQVYLTQRSAPLGAQVLAVDSGRTLTLPDPMLDAAHGGRIRVATVKGRAEVQQALYRVRLRLDQPPPSAQTQLAQVVIQGAAHSLLGEAVRWAGGVVVRESGF
jgi:putative peptide zinc metalloprotease protein